MNGAAASIDPFLAVKILVPDAANAEKDIMSTFCHFVYYFPSRPAAEAWAAQHPGTLILSVAEAHAVARRKNREQYGEALGSR